MDHTMTAELPLRALNMAVSRRNPPAGLIHHSDRGSQYADPLFQTALKDNEMLCSMSRKGDCWDNAVVESFFETLKRELMDGCVYRSHEEARKAIFEYVGGGVLQPKTAAFEPGVLDAPGSRVPGYSCLTLATRNRVNSTSCLA